MCYVLNNARKHGLRLAQAVDLFSSACWFDGWRERFRTRGLPAAIPVATARTWLLTLGWRRHGLICPDEVPGNLSPG